VTGPDAVEAGIPPEELPWHPVLAEVFGSLARDGVPWCLLRPPAHPAAPSGDVDLLVDRRARNRAGRVLAALGFGRIPNGGTPDAFYLRYDAGTDCWLYLHVTSEISFGPHRELRTGAAAACLARRVRWGAAWQLREDDDFWVTLLHAVVDKGSLSPRHRQRLSALADPTGHATGPVAAAVAPHLADPGDAGRLLRWARDGQERELLGAAQAAVDRWCRAAGHEPAGQRVRRLFRLAAGLRNPWRRRGLSIALLGPDGAGKSTLAEGLTEHFFFPVWSVYMDIRAEELARKAPPVPGLVFLTYLVLLWGRLAGARRRQARGELVVFDRYTYDALVTAEPATTAKQRVARWMHGHLFPRAGLTLVLDLPGEVMFARKGERDPEQLEQERQRLLRLHERVGVVEVLDATQPVELVRRDAVARIWDRYATRWGARPPAPTPGADR